GILLLGAALGDDADDLVVTHRVLDQRNGLGSPDCQRQHAAREEDRVAKRKDRQHLGDVFLRDQTWRDRASAGATLLFRRGVTASDVPLHAKLDSSFYSSLDAVTLCWRVAGSALRLSFARLVT